MYQTTWPVELLTPRMAPDWYPPRHPQAVAALLQRVCAGHEREPDVAHVELGADRGVRHVVAAVLAGREQVHEVFVGTVVQAAIARRPHHERLLSAQVVGRLVDQPELTGVGRIRLSLEAVPVRGNAVLIAGNLRAQVLLDYAQRIVLALQGPRLRRRREVTRVARDCTHFDGKRRLAVGAIQRELEGRLACVEDDLLRLTADHDVGEHGRKGVVHVPDVVPDRLEVPLVRPGLVVEGDHRAAEQIVARPTLAILRAIAAAHIAKRYIDHPELGIDRALLPRRRPAGEVAVVRRVVGRDLRRPGVAGIEGGAVHVGERRCRADRRRRRSRPARRRWRAPRRRRRGRCRSSP